MGQAGGIFAKCGRRPLFTLDFLTFAGKYDRNLAVYSDIEFKVKYMMINVDRISEKGIQVNDSAELDENLLVEEGAFFLEDVNHNLHLSRDGKKINVKGKIKTAVSLKCIRCLEYYELKINSKFDIILFPARLIEVAHSALNHDDMEYIFYEGDKIDMAKILIEQVNLFIPYSPVCGKNCKGICPNCGMNLNKYECKCDSSLDEISLLFNKNKR